VAIHHPSYVGGGGGASYVNAKVPWAQDWRVLFCALAVTCVGFLVSFVAARSSGALGGVG
jgi:hypothetical protein